MPGSRSAHAARSSRTPATRLQTLAVPWVVFGIFGLAACSGASDPGGGGNGPGDDPMDEPPVGSLQVTTATGGSDLDPDGYTVSVTGQPDRQIGVTGSTTYADRPVGTYSVALGGIAANCGVDGANPRSVSVTADATEVVAFDVLCEELPRGTLEVTTSVTNNFDPDGFLVHVDGAPIGEVDVDASGSFVVIAGTRTVELRELAPNCAVIGDNPRSVEIPEGDAGSLLFDVVCESPPDGRIAVIGRHPSIPSDVWGISVMNSDGSGRLFIFDCAAVCLRPRWSADGTEIAFAWPQPGSARHIFVVSQDGRSVRRVTDGPYVDDFATWSPDGEWIVFARLELGNLGTPGLRPWRLHRIRSDGTGLTSLPAPEDGLGDLEPDWSPDGSRIAFVRRGITSDDGELVEMLLAVSPDGAVLDTIVGNSPVLSGGEREYYDRAPAWSPDGTRIAFDRRMHQTVDPFGEPYVARVHTAAADGTDIRAPGSNFEQASTLPSWSPDGTRLVIEDGDGSVYVMPVDGSQLTLIDPPSMSSGEPDWGP